MPANKATLDMDFAVRMQELEKKFAAAAEVDGDVYLPNFMPRKPVDAVLIAMEPSIGRWAQTPEEANLKIAAGFRNFISSPEVNILHYTARRFLCRPGETYHITDISKGAMTVEKANIDRERRYERWFALLDEEIGIVAKPEARMVAIGQAVFRFLNQQGFKRPISTILHYSAQASAARNAAVIGRESEFRAFSETLSMEEIISAAVEFMRENSVSTAMMEETLAHLRKSKLTESRRKLAFIYSTAFGTKRAIGVPASGG